MRVLVLQDKQVIRDVTFDEGPVSLGSDARCGVHLPDMRIDLEHARLVVNAAGQWTVEAAGATARAEVNGRELQQRCPIYNGDEIAIGDFVLKVAVDAEHVFGPTGKTSLDELARIRDFPLPRGGEVRRSDEPITIDPDQHRALARFGQELAGCGDLQTLMDRALEHLLDTFPARRAWLGLRRQPLGSLEVMEGRESDGGGGHDPPMLATLEYRCLERGQCIRLRRLAGGGSALAIPLEARRGRLGVIYLESKRQATFGREQLDLLFATGLPVAARLETILLGVVEQREATADGGWDMLREVQARLDPTNVPNWPDCQLAVYCRPGLDRGGDVYDFMTMPNGMATLIVSNVTADPVRSAMAVTEVHAAFRVAALHADPPRTLLRELNWLLHDGRSSCRLCVAQVVMNPKTGAMEFNVAGSIGALIIDARGRARDLADAKAAPLGVNKSVELPRRSERLAAGEMLALFTRGWANLCDESGRAVSRERFIGALCDGFGLAPANLLEELQSDLASFFKRGRQPDDITILLLKHS
jgi:serine phosphatase RsbU (regulator of sigma subunit)